ncbi:MAG: DUF2029 domain-containing protein [Chloroflexi bacterium]|nr:MAG: DUF2029 domain-containing protein [Chloroflexota bacterium]MBL1192891.1 DUF2029 domain-containing protein [Chloroflexota bacterium]NOH10183.1 DUF2029 domain-containing protein [Chloroflexota bacterium]
MRKKQDAFAAVRDRYGILPAVLLVAIPISVVLCILFLINYQVAGGGGYWVYSDFTMMWLGGKGILDGADLYNPVDWKRLHDLYAPIYRDNPIFLFPMPAAFLFVPFALMPVNLGATLWLLLGELFLFVVIGDFVRKLSIRHPLALLGLFLLVAFFSPIPIIILTGQYSLIMLFLLWAVYAFMKRGQDLLAGICLTLLILRPNPFVILLPVLLAWALWKRRWTFFVGNGVSGLFLLAITWMMRPGWLTLWLEYVVGNSGKIHDYGPITPTLWGIVSDLGRSLTLNMQTAISAALSILIILVVLWMVLRHRSLALDAVLAVSMALSLFVTPYAWNYDQVLLLFPVFYALVLAEKLTAEKRRGVWVAAVFVLSAWPYFLRYIAYQRDLDTFSGLVPFVVLVLVLGTMHLIPERTHETVL